MDFKNGKKIENFEIKKCEFLMVLEVGKRGRAGLRPAQPRFPTSKTIRNSQFFISKFSIFLPFLKSISLCSFI